MIRDRLFPALASLLSGPTPPGPFTQAMGPTPEARAADKVYQAVHDSIPATPPAPPSRRADAIYNPLTGMGGSNDKGQAARPIYNWPLQWQELDDLYHLGGYARRIVGTYATDSVRAGWSVDGEDDRDCMIDEDRRLQIHARFGLAELIAGVHGVGAILVVTTERGNPPLSEPLDPSKLISVDNLVPLDGYEARPYWWCSDLRSPRFRLPERWSVWPRVPSGVPFDGSNVHGSRIILVRGREKLPTYQYDARYGQGLDVSLLQVCWDPLRNLVSIEQAAAIISGEMRMDVVTLENMGAKSAGDQQEEVDAVMRGMAKARGLLNLILMPPGATYTPRTGTVTGFRELREAARESFAAHVPIPQVYLYGDSPSGLNTDGASWRAFWELTIDARWKTAHYSALTDLYRLLFAAQRGPFKGKAPASWDIKRRPLFVPTVAEQAAVRKTNAEADALYVNAGILSPEHVARSRFRETGYGDEILPFEDLPDEDPAAQAAAEEEMRNQVRASKQEPGQVAEPGKQDGARMIKGKGINRMTIDVVAKREGLDYERLLVGTRREMEERDLDYQEGMDAALKRLREDPNFYPRISYDFAAIAEREGVDHQELETGAKEEMDEHGIPLEQAIQFAVTHLKKNAHYYALVRALVETNE